MVKKIITCTILVIINVYLIFPLDLKASIAQLPGLADSPEKGAFIDLVKAIAAAYKDGKITIGVYPFARSVNNVIDGFADFHIPNVRNPMVDQTKLPYRNVAEPMGLVCFVIYSNKNKPYTKDMLEATITSNKKTTYSIEVPGGIENQFPFMCKPSNDIDQSLKKISSGRIDALIRAQKEVDERLKTMKLKNIKREFWMNFEDVIIIAKGKEGNRIDKILSEVLISMKKDGSLAKLHTKVHHTYDNWQPYDMGW